jgi:hypothetical protein
VEADVPTWLVKPGADVCQALERDEAAIEIWKIEVWPEIRAPAATWAPTSASMRPVTARVLYRRSPQCRWPDVQM